MRTIRKNNILAFTALLFAVRAGAGEQPEGPTAEPIDYGQLGAILGYVASDYSTAVGPAGVLSPQEYSEQKGFLADAISLSAGLGSLDFQVGPLLRAAQTAVERAAPAEQVVPKVTQALAILEQHHDLGRAPKQLPSFSRGKELYAQACEACHAADGSGHTPLHLTTRPPDLHDPRQSGPLSPARVFSAVTYGVPGTAMPAYDLAYPDSDRWNLAFYFLTLAHAGTARDRSVLADFALTELAAQTDDQLRATLAKRLPSALAQERALAALRVEGPYRANAALDSRLLSGCRQRLAEVQRSYETGDRAAARHAAVAAYLDDFEPFEPALRAKSPRLVSALEGAFSRLRSAIDEGAPADRVAADTSELSRLVLEAEDAVQTGNPSVSFAAALAIALREGLEAALLLSALLALAHKSNRPRARTAVHLGWSGALLSGLATWFLSGVVISGSGRNRELTEGVTVLLTAALLLWASHWILAQASAKKLTSFLSRQAKLVRGAGWGLGGLAFLAIYREMFEIVVFYRGLLLQGQGQGPGHGRAVLLGALAGLGALAIVVVGFQRMGRKLRPRPLLMACGALLCGLSVVMVGEGIRALQEAGVVGEHLVAFPEVPQLGVFATAQGLWAQGLLLAGLVASVIYSSVRSQPDRASAASPPMPGGPTPLAR